DGHGVSRAVSVRHFEGDCLDRSCLWRKEKLMLKADEQAQALTRGRDSLVRRRRSTDGRPHCLDTTLGFSWAPGYGYSRYGVSRDDRSHPEGGRPSSIYRIQSPRPCHLEADLQTTRYRFVAFRAAQIGPRNGTDRLIFCPYI